MCVVRAQVEIQLKSPSSSSGIMHVIYMRDETTIIYKPMRSCIDDAQTVEIRIHRQHHKHNHVYIIHCACFVVDAESIISHVFLQVITTQGEHHHQTSTVWLKF